MTPPRICPQPPHPEDCPLYAQRLPYGVDEPLRRAILMERGRSLNLADLIRAQADRPQPLPPASPPTRPALPPPQPVATPLFNARKGASQ